MTVLRTCSKKVIERQPKNGAWLTVLSCGHERFVRHMRDRHICYECRRQEQQKRTSSYAWMLQTSSGFTLVKGRMFKAETQVKLDEIERFQSVRSAQNYAASLSITFALQAVKVKVLQAKEAA